MNCPKCDKPLDEHSWLQPPLSYLMPDGSVSEVGVCFDCQAKIDRDFMSDFGKITLYLAPDAKDGASTVYNWCASLSFHCTVSVTRTQNRVRRDVWFTGPDGHVWYGLQQGRGLCYCRRTKTYHVGFSLKEVS